MKWQMNPEVVVQRLGDSMVLVNLASDRILELNDTAATLFELLSSGVEEADLESRMAQIFEVDRELVRNEIPAVVASLEAEEVVTRVT